MEIRPMAEAPKTAKWILLKMPRRRGYPNFYWVVAHWADGGGEEQPRFRGWFYDTGFDYRGLTEEPIGWVELPGICYEQS